MAVSPAERERSPRPARPGAGAPRTDAVAGALPTNAVAGDPLPIHASGEAATPGALSAQTLVGLLATPARLRVVASIVLGASTPAEIAVATGLAESEVGPALNRLVRGRLVRTVDGALCVDPNVFTAAAREGAPARAPVDYGVSDPKVAAILRAFLVDGRLTRIPGAGRKRTAVLEYLVATFEPGQRYPETEVNAILASFHPDTAALRRYLVDEGFLSRDAGVYWRTGGWVDVL